MCTVFAYFAHELSLHFSYIVSSVVFMRLGHAAVQESVLAPGTCLSKTAVGDKAAIVNRIPYLTQK